MVISLPLPISYPTTFIARLCITYMYLDKKTIQTITNIASVEVYNKRGLRLQVNVYHTSYKSIDLLGNRMRL